MVSNLIHFFIPNADNDYKPHFFRETCVSILALAVFILFLFSVAQTKLLGTAKMLALIYPNVLIDLTNSERQAVGVRQLKKSLYLQEAARRKANDMAEKGYFAHTSPDGATSWYWFREAGYRYQYAGENLAVNFVDSKDVESAWMRSPSHRANILNKNYTEIGVATSKGRFGGREATFVVQMFGRPLDSGDEMVKGLQSTLLDQPQQIFMQIVSSPRYFFSLLYFILGFVVALAMALMIFIEVRRQHMRHILYGLLLLGIVYAAYSAGTFIFPTVQVI